MTSSLCVIRADASDRIGKGHVVRCIALANALEARGLSCSFAGRPQTKDALREASGGRFDCLSITVVEDQESSFLQSRFPQGIEVLIVDHYERGLAFETALRDHAKVIVAIDGRGGTHNADIVVSPGPGLSTPKSDCEGAVLLEGAEYAILRPQFEGVLKRRREIINRVNVPRVLVSFGGSKTLPYLQRAVEALSACETEMDVDVLVAGEGPLPVIPESKSRIVFHRWLKDPSELFVHADLYVGAAGGMALEAAAVGVPSLLIPIADNQLPIASILKQAGACKTLSAEEGQSVFCEALLGLLEDRKGLDAMSDAGRAAVGTQGAEMIADAIVEQLERKAVT